MGGRWERGGGHSGLIRKLQPSPGSVASFTLYGHAERVWGTSPRYGLTPLQRGRAAQNRTLENFYDDNSERRTYYKSFTIYTINDLIIYEINVKYEYFDLLILSKKCTKKP